MVCIIKIGRTSLSLVNRLKLYSILYLERSRWFLLRVTIPPKCFWRILIMQIISSILIMKVLSILFVYHLHNSELVEWKLLPTAKFYNEGHKLH